MDTSKDVAQATAATDPVIDSKPAAETTAAPASAAIAPAEPQLPPAPALASGTVEAAAAPASPIEPVKPIEATPAASSTSTSTSTAVPPPRRKEPPPIVVPPLAARTGMRKDGAPPRSARFGILAASVALAAGIGAALGVAGYAAASKMLAPVPAQQRPAAGDEIKAEIKALRDQIAQTRAGVRTLTDNVAALKGTFESAGKASGGQFAKVNETIARLAEGVERTERMQAEPAARLAKVIETLERLERRAAGLAGAPETTGSIAGQQPKPAGQSPQSLQQQQQQLQAQPPVPPLPAPQIVAEAKASAPPIVEGWVLHRVQGGVALIEGRFGIAEVEAGDTIRGIGRVQEIKRQDGRWVVVTARGLIVPGR